MHVTLAKHSADMDRLEWAVEGLTEAISQERGFSHFSISFTGGTNVHKIVKPEWNIKLTLIEPGCFPTEVAQSNIDYAANKIPAYDHISGEQWSKWFNEVAVVNGDVRKAVARMYELAKMEKPPFRVVLGGDAVEFMRGKFKRDTSEVRLAPLLPQSTTSLTTPSVGSKVGDILEVN